MVSGCGGGTVAILHGSEGPVLAVFCDAAGDLPGQRWFTVILSDAPPPDSDDVELWCAHCLLEEHPEAGQGMDLVVEHGCVIRDPASGEWRVSETGDFTYEEVEAAAR